MPVAAGLDRQSLFGFARRSGRPVPRHTQRRERAAHHPVFAKDGYEVEVEHNSEKHVLRVREGESILEAALDSGLDLPHDCRLGVCMTCPARLVKGKVDQSGSMLSEDVAGMGYALLCVAMPESNCQIKTIDEEELLQLQLKTSEY